jgi:hypothetical protein
MGMFLDLLLALCPQGFNLAKQSEPAPVSKSLQRFELR